VEDLLVPHATYPGSLVPNLAAVVRSGVDGRPIGVLETGTNYSGGAAAALDDVDGDGYRDLLVGVTDHTGLSESSSVRLYSGFVDCDGDAAHDWTQIALGAVPDANANAIPDACEPPPLAADDVYCTAKPSFHGCIAAIAAYGEPTLPQRTLFWLQATGVRWSKSGLFFFGRGRTALPFLGGTLCVQPPLARGPVLFSGGPDNSCLGVLTMEAGDFFEATGLFNPGETLNVQVWYRDPPDPFGVALSDALEFTIAP